MHGYLLASHVAQTAHASSNGKYIPYLVMLVIGVVIGRVWGRSAGLKHLGSAEYQARWRNVRSVRRF